MRAIRLVNHCWRFLRFALPTVRPSTPRRLANRRYSRCGNLRYLPCYAATILGQTAAAQFDHPQAVSVRSASGQFIIHAMPLPANAAVAVRLTEDENYLKLEPALTAVSCERVKRALTDFLGGNSKWRDRIHLVLYPARSAGEDATIVSERFKNSWNYRLELPNPVEPTRYVRAVVFALLLEQAGRNAREHLPEVPAWLAEGLTQHLLQANDRELFLPPPRRATNRLAVTRTVVSERRRDPLETARRVLRERSSLTLAELSWPTNEQLEGPARETYRCSAQLFVTELLRLKDGRACLRAMLEGLGECYNWQTAFLRAFRSHFERQVDVEKWWELQLVHFTGRDHTRTWSPDETWQKLDEVLRTPVEVRHARDKLPGRAEVSLAAVIREWDSVRQSQTLRAKVNELDFLRLRASRDFIGLVDDYRRWLTGYLDRLGRPPALLFGKRILMRETLKQLAELESRREAMRPQPKLGPPTPGQTDVTATP